MKITPLVLHHDRKTSLAGLREAFDAEPASPPKITFRQYTDLDSEAESYTTKLAKTSPADVEGEDAGQRGDGDEVSCRRAMRGIGSRRCFSKPLQGWVPCGPWW
ncbi:hypothetical protein [Microbacterium hydrocarbonoxydans]|uniref:Uncharacterized protein n=1 Tax=Microbacterium hydrocarbonoxydans TaxID=273678 RepID=A0A1H4RLK6_9MICO|nr:hypothetical protein [Microbacterium hydrocarbonoxydans]SEC32739.1 hypothetical protein SAMN04489807_3432 [Microbacterium hydrocarbonoxydans]